MAHRRQEQRDILPLLIPNKSDAESEKRVRILRTQKICGLRYIVKIFLPEDTRSRDVANCELGVA